MAQIVTEDDFIKFIREALSKDRHAVAIFLSLESLRKFPENIILQELVEFY